MISINLIFFHLRDYAKLCSYNYTTSKAVTFTPKAWIFAFVVCMAHEFCFWKEEHVNNLKWYSGNIISTLNFIPACLAEWWYGNVYKEVKFWIMSLLVTFYVFLCPLCINRNVNAAPFPLLLITGSFTCCRPWQRISGRLFLLYAVAYVCYTCFKIQNKTAMEFLLLLIRSIKFTVCKIFSSFMVFLLPLFHVWSIFISTHYIVLTLMTNVRLALYDYYKLVIWSHTWIKKSDFS